jgi:two-component system, NtrC family, sensor kinase
MKQLIVLAYLLILTTAVNSQKLFSSDSTERRRYEDSVEQAYSLSKPDTNRLEILRRLWQIYARAKPDAAMRLATERLELARKLHLPEDEAESLRFQGLIMVWQGRFPEAMRLFIEALRIAESLNDERDIGGATFDIGHVYLYQHNYALAKPYLFKGAQMHNKGRARGDVIDWIRIGQLYYETNHLDSALFFYNRSLEFSDDPESFLPDLPIGLGNVYNRIGNYGKAFKYYKQGILLSLHRHDNITLNESYYGLAVLYKKLGQIDSSIFYAKKALDAADKVPYFNGIYSTSKTLSELYEKIDEHRAFQYLKISTSVQDSIFNAEKMLEAENMGLWEDERQQSVAAEKREYRNKVKINLVIGASIVLLVFAVILYRNNKHKQRANELLHNEKKQVEEQRLRAEQTLKELRVTQAQLIQSEKMASLGELTAGIAHEIQNPLNFVNNFSAINKELITEMKEEIDKGNYPEVKAIAHDIEDNEEKIVYHGKRADAIVKGMLQHSRSSTGKKELTNINALADEYLRLSYHGLRAKDKDFNSRFITNFDSSIGKIEVAPQDIGRVLLNLYNNAFYSVNEKKKQLNGTFEPTVEVSTKRVGDKVEINVKDNGTGISQKVLDKIYQPFFTTKPTGQGTGLGLSLSYEIVTKGHGGEMKVETKEGEGAEFTIILKQAL